MLAPHLDDLKARTEKTIESDAPAETAEAE
jgi:hypothetical protein